MKLRTQVDEMHEAIRGKKIIDRKMITEEDEQKMFGSVMEVLGEDLLLPNKSYNEVFEFAVGLLTFGSYCTYKAVINEEVHNIISMCDFDSIQTEDLPQVTM